MTTTVDHFIADRQILATLDDFDLSATLAPDGTVDRVWGSGGGTGSGTPGAASPMHLGLERWGVDQVLWSPGADGNYGSVPDTNYLRNDQSTPDRWNAGGSVSDTQQHWMHIYGNRAAPTIDLNETSPLGRGVVKTDNATNGDTRFGVGPVYSYTAGEVVTTVAYVKAGTGVPTGDVNSYLSTSDITAGAGAVGASSYVREDIGGGWIKVSNTQTVTTSGLLRFIISAANATDANAVEYWIGGFSARKDSTREYLPTHRIVGDLSLLWWGVLKDYTPGSSMNLVSKRSDTAGNSYDIAVLNTGLVRMIWTDSAGTGLSGSSTVAVSTIVPDREPIAIIGELDVDDGAGNHTVRFWTSTDFTTDGHATVAAAIAAATWTQLGATVTTAGTTSIKATAAPVNFGARNNGTAEMLLGANLAAGIYDGLVISGAATEVLSADFTDPSVVDGDVSTTAEGHTLNINRSGNAQAELVRQPCLAVSTSDEDWQLPSRDAWLPDDGPAGIAVGAKLRGFVNSGGMFAKGNWNSAAPRFGLIGRSVVGGVRFEVANDSATFSTVDAAVPTGTWLSLLAEHDPGVTNKIYNAGVELATVADAGGTVNPTGSVHAFQLPGFATLVQVGLYRWTMFLRRLLTEAERTELGEWDGSIAAEPDWLRDAATFYWNAADPAAASRYVETNEVVNLATAAATIETAKLPVVEEAPNAFRQIDVVAAGVGTLDAQQLRGGTWVGSAPSTTLPEALRIVVADDARLDTAEVILTAGIKQATADLFARLPALYRPADVGQDWPLLRYLSLLGDQLGDLVDAQARIDHRPPDDAGDPDDPLHNTSDLVDPERADAAWLEWLAQLVGVEINSALSESEKRSALQSASAGWRAATKTAIGDAAKTALTGSQYVDVRDHSITITGSGTASQWDVLIVTRTDETPDASAVIAAVVAKGAKPAGVQLHHQSYEATWDQVETAHPAWSDWDTLDWQDLEETQ